jgi:hypothetical protein
MIVVVLISNTVISDRLFLEIKSKNTDINLINSPSINSTSEDSIKINLKPIILLVCVGLVGIVVFGRQRIADKENDKDITA